MSSVTIKISDELQAKLTKIAHQIHCSFDDCIDYALREYAENYSDYYKTELCAVNNSERAFFFSAAE